MNNIKNNSTAGFSVIELLAVVVIVAILSMIAYTSLSESKLYEADRQANQIIDMLQEGRQRSISQRNTLRVEINSTDNSIRLIDEKDNANAADDVVIESADFMNNGVFIGTTPPNLSAGPTELSPVLPITFKTSTHPLSVGDKVATVRFRRGTAQDAGNDAIGTGSIPTGASIYVWSKNENDTSQNPNGNVIRAITVLGSTGSTRLWKCAISSGDCSTWNH